MATGAACGDAGGEGGCSIDGDSLVCAEGWDGIDGDGFAVGEAAAGEIEALVELGGTVVVSGGFGVLAGGGEEVTEGGKRFAQARRGRAVDGLADLAGTCDVGACGAQLAGFDAGVGAVGG